MRLALVLAGLVVTAPAFANITPIADVERGSMTTVSGVVERLLDEDEFRLSDETGDIRVYVGPNWVPADVGEMVTVSGFVDNDVFKEIYAREITRADGTVVTLDRRYE